VLTEVYNLYSLFLQNTRSIGVHVIKQGYTKMFVTY